MHSVYTSAPGGRASFAESRIIPVSQLLRAAIVALTIPQARSAARNQHITAVINDELSNESLPDYATPTVREGPLSAITRAWESDPADPRTMYDWAKRLGVSPKTLSRAFKRSTQMTFRDYRSHLRVQTAIEKLALGESVTSVAYGLGYSSVSRFGSLFREITGATPREFTKKRTKPA